MQWVTLIKMEPLSVWWVGNGDLAPITITQVSRPWPECRV